MSCLSSALSGSETPDGVSGGGQSADGKCSYGYACSRGKRSTMEDCYEARFAQVEDFTIGLFGVFDGHGGSQAAEYVRKNLFDNLIKHPKLITDTKIAIVETYQQTDSEFLQEEINEIYDAGSTASTAILVGDRLVVANVGDSRAVICRGSTAYALSEDHKPNRKDERQRIEKAGGVVIWAGTWRVGGILAVSRAFGDRSLKQFVVAEPELQEETINDGVKFLILASDGLWDVVSNQDAVTLVEAISDAEDAAKSLRTRMRFPLKSPEFTVSQVINHFCQRLTSTIHLVLFSVVF
ncbi:hypothetical protein GOP47_0015314 [Adiantum capillus-veneris]|uniref:protein-serine/threonine phosphatase n=1 Tax=Adiantum capillus-veneris TaxID=13818 RepID=A0A9D4UJF0_ADICA|nr:hypothetical protein GOP47_0015314 [Adiantum capillus-veneris]